MIARSCFCFENNYCCRPNSFASFLFASSPCDFVHFVNSDFSGNRTPDTFFGMKSRGQNYITVWKDYERHHHAYKKVSLSTEILSLFAKIVWARSVRLTGGNPLKYLLFEMSAETVFRPFLRTLFFRRIIGTAFSQALFAIEIRRAAKICTRRKCAANRETPALLSLYRNLLGKHLQ